MLHWRLIIGTLLVAMLVGLCCLDYGSSTSAGVWLIPLALVVTLLATREYLWLLETKQLRPAAPILYTGNLLAVASMVLPRPSMEGQTLDWLPLILACGAIVAFLAEMRRYEAPGRATIQVALSILGLIYIGLFMNFVVRLRFVSGGIPLLLLIVVVKMSDIGAYTVGRLIGRHKLAPTLSPGKTWEGAFGGLVFGCLGAALVLNVLAPIALRSPLQFSWSFTITLGLVISIAGMAGDLAESLFKRDVGRKDSSDWMPGFGGVLDILDSVLFAAPVAYVCWLLMMAAA